MAASPAAPASIPKAPAAWYEISPKRSAYCVMLLGLVLAMISLGAFIVGAVAPDPIHAWYWDGTVIDMERSQSIQAAMTGGIFSSIMSLPGLLVGLVIIGAGGGMLRRANAQEKKAKSGPAEGAVTTAQVVGEANHKKRKNITLILGVAIAMIGVGMIINSSILLHNSVPSVQDLVERAIREKWAHQDFWQAVKTEWLQPAQWRLPLMTTVGVFTTIGGGGLILSASGYSLCRSAVKKKLDAPAENAVAAATEAALSGPEEL